MSPNKAGSSRSSKPLTFEDFQRELKELLKANPHLMGGSDTIYDLVIEADNEEDRARYSKRLSDMMAESNNRRKRSGRPPKKVRQPGQSDEVSKKSVPEIVLSSDEDDEDDEVQVIDFEQDDGRVILSVKRGQGDTKRGHGVIKEDDYAKSEVDVDIDEVFLSSDSEDIELDEECDDDDDEVQVLSDTRIDLSSGSDLSSPGQSKSSEESKSLLEQRLIKKSWSEYQRRYNVSHGNENPSKQSQNTSDLVTSVTLKDEDDMKPDINIVILDSDEDDDDVIEIDSEIAMTTLSDSDSDCELNDSIDELDLDPPSLLDDPPEGQLDNRTEGQEAIATTEEILKLLEQEPMPVTEMLPDPSEDEPMEDEEQVLDLALSLQEDIASQKNLRSLPKPPEDSSILLTPQESPDRDLATSIDSSGPDLSAQDGPIEEEILSRLSNLLNLQTAPDTPDASPAFQDRLICNLSQLLDLEYPSAGSKIGPTGLQLTSEDPQEQWAATQAALPVEPASTGGHQSDLESQAGASEGTQHVDETEPEALINSEGFLDLDECLDSDEVPNPEVLTALISNEPGGHPVTPAPEAFTFVRPSSQIQAIPSRSRNKVTRKKKHQPRPPPLGSCIPTHQIMKPLGASAKKLDAIMNPNKKSRPIKPKKVPPSHHQEVLEAPGPAFSLRIRPSTSKNIAAQKPKKPPVYVPRLPKTSWGPQMKPKNNFYILTCTLMTRTAVADWPVRTEGQTIRDEVRPRRPEVPGLDLIVTASRGSLSPQI